MAQQDPSQYPGQRFCDQCGSALEPGANFCASCGASQVVDTTRPYDPATSGDSKPEYMGFWIRFAAILIDYVVIWVATLILSTLIGFWGFFAIYLITYAYFVLFTAGRGQTLGKMVVGIQVVDSQGNVPSFGRVLLREVIGKFVSGLVLYLGYAWAGWDPDKRAWHDHIASTFVIRKEREQVL